MLANENVLPENGYMSFCVEAGIGTAIGVVDLQATRVELLTYPLTFEHSINSNLPLYPIKLSDKIENASAFATVGNNIIFAIVSESITHLSPGFRKRPSFD
jgi:hypothetical protein